MNMFKTHHHEIAEWNVLKNGQRVWLQRLRQKIWAMAQSQLLHGMSEKMFVVKHCAKIGMPVCLYDRSGNLEDYIEALKTWQRILEAKGLMARLGAARMG